MSGLDSLICDPRLDGLVLKSHLMITIFLKVHKREKFFGSDFEFFTIL